MATAGCIRCSQEQSPKRRDIHCSVCRGLLQSPWLFHLLSLIVQTIVNMASADYLSRHLIENPLISIDVSSICTIFNIFILPLWHWQAHRTAVISSTHALTHENELTSFGHGGMSHICHSRRLCACQLPKAPHMLWSHTAAHLEQLVFAGHGEVRCVLTLQCKQMVSTALLAALLTGFVFVLPNHSFRHQLWSYGFQRCWPGDGYTRDLVDIAGAKDIFFRKMEQLNK